MTPPGFASRETLDPAFGNNGTSLIGQADRYLFPVAMAVAADGAILLAVNASDAAGSDLLLLRYDSLGQPDAGFGQAGSVTTAFQAGGGSAFAMFLQADGSILLAGDHFNGTTLDFAVARYRADGSLDTEFATAGLATTDFGRDDRARALAVQADGRIILVGQTFGGDHTDFAVARYLANGQPDTGFAAGGKTTVDFRKAGDGASAVALQGDGKLLVAGSSFNGSRGDDFALVRFNPDGRFDGSFGSGGAVTTAIQGASNDVVTAIAVQADGRIVLAGRSFTGQTAQATLVRYLADGRLDGSFGNGGIVTTGQMEAATDVILRPDGKLVMAGTARNDFGLMRFAANGQVDTPFGNNGLVTSGLAGRMERIDDLEIQADGRLLAAGSRLNGTTRSAILLRFGWDTALPALPEDDPDPAGVVLRTLYEPVYVDADGHALVGVAVSAPVNRANEGVWQYRSDEATDWYPLGDLAYQTALLLGADARLRFLPARDYAGTPQSPLFHLVDDSGGFSPTRAADRSIIDLTATVALEAVSAQGIPLSVQVLPVNDPPTLSRIGTLPGGLEDTAYRLDYPTLLAASDALDVDGDALAFRIESVSAGSVTVDGQPVSPGSPRLAASAVLTWIPPANANGMLSPFSVVAIDAAGATSPAVAVTVGLAPVNDPPTLSRIGTLPGGLEDTAYRLDYPTLLAASDALDVDGEALAFRIESVSAGSVTVDGQPVSPGSTRLAASAVLTWIPPANANGMLSPFSVVAIDAAGATSSAVAVTVGLTPVNDPPRITLGSGASPVYLEGGKPLLPLATLELSDPDSPDLSGATIGLVAFNPLDGLTLNPGAVPLVWQYQPATGELRVSGVAPLAAYRDLLRGLSFSTRQDLTRPELRPLQLTLDDDTGSSQALTVTLALQPSILNGTAAADTLTGTRANDVINGLAGDDWLDGRAGADRMLGGSGNDTYRVDEAGDFIREDIGAGYDRVRASLSRVLAANLEELTLTGNQPLDGTGNGLGNRLYGNSAANRLVGMGGADTLSGGGGADTLTGGTGADLFTLASVNDSRPGSADLIVDFNRRHADRIKLTALDANSQKPGNQAFAFIGSAPFSGAGQLRYVYDAGTATGILSGDIDGDRLPDIQIELIGVKIITLTDLLP